VTKALVESLEVKIETVRVIVLEVPKAHWGIAGKPVGQPREVRDALAWLPLDQVRTDGRRS
jgi:phenylpyruvate tautomerase PptA (4-oxalocrotonate tautomerase family)